MNVRCCQRGLSGQRHSMKNLVALVLELDAAAETRDGELGALRQSMRSLKRPVRAEKDRANKTEARAHKTLDKLSELRTLVEADFNRW